ncbi:MAG: AtpZ/AtpI family protein [Lachnospiraceae bacterium]|nr:AtpZ/AtpI family protein [Lachnospiraceae bacterium]
MKGTALKGSNKSSIRYLAYISQFAINMLVPIFLCSAIGYFIDKRLGTSWVFIVLFFVGAVAGARNIYILAKREYTDDRGKE